MLSLEIKPTDKCREALLRAELIAWACNRKEVTELDLRIALSEQADTVAKALEDELEEDDFSIEQTIDETKIRSQAQIVFQKITLNDALLKILQQASLETSRLDVPEINTGHLLIELLFSEKNFHRQLKERDLNPTEFKEALLEKACNSVLIDGEKAAANEVLSRFNRKIFNWLREGNLTNELLTENGIDDFNFGSSRTIARFLDFLGEDENKEIPEILPPYSRGISEKARRDLEVIDSYVAAKNLPEADPDMLGMFMVKPNEMVLFFEKEFAYLSGENLVSLRYDEIESIETFELEEVATHVTSSAIAITGGDNLEIEIEIPTIMDEINELNGIEVFLQNARDPQPIREINSDQDFLTFLKRQNKNMDLYYRLAYKTEELWELGFWDADEEKGAQQTLLLRLLAIICTVPVQSMRLSEYR